MIDVHVTIPQVWASASHILPLLSNTFGEMTTSRRQISVMAPKFLSEDGLKPKLSIRFHLPAMRRLSKGKITCHKDLSDVFCCKGITSLDLNRQDPVKRSSFRSSMTISKSGHVCSSQSLSSFP